jgi:dienelactone hydrolase
MTNSQQPEPPLSPLRDDIDAKLPAAAYLRYENRADGWSAGRQAACLAHLADHGLIADAVRSVGMSVGGSYALRRTARGYAFNLGWEAALIIARRIVADNLMTAAIKGEESR